MSERDGDSKAAYAGLGCAVAVAVAIYWVWPALPFQDLPGHAGLVALRARIATTPFDQEYFVHAPRLGPYTVFRALGEFFSKGLGPIGAVRMLATLPVIALPLSVLASRRLLGFRTDVAQGYLAILLSFGFMTISGFASYNLAIAVLVLTVSAHVALLEDDATPTRRKRLAAAVACLSAALYLSHGFAFCMGAVAVFFATLVKGAGSASFWNRIRTLFLWLPGVSVAAYASYVEAFGSLPPGARMPTITSGTYYDSLLGKASLLLTPTLMSRLRVDAAFSVILWIAMVAALLRARKRMPSSTRRMLAATAALFAVFCILPHGIGWFGFVDGRLAPILFLLPIVALPDPTWPKHFLRFGAPVMAFVALLHIHVLSALFQGEAKGANEVLRAVPARAHLLSLMVNPDSKYFTASSFTHYDKLVMAERESVPSSMWFHQGTALYPTAKNPVLALPMSYREADLGKVDWPAYKLADWDYVFMRWLPEDGPPDVPPGLDVVAHEGAFWLFSVRPKPPEGAH